MPPLDELSSLTTVPGPTSPSPAIAAPQAYAKESGCRRSGIPQQPEPATSRWGAQSPTANVSILLLVRMILIVLTYNVRSNNNQPTRNRDGGDALWNEIFPPVGNESARRVDPRLVPQAVGPIRGVVPTTTTRAQPSQQPPQGESALILSIAVPLMPIQAQGDNLCRLLHHSHRW